MSALMKHQGLFVLIAKLYSSNYHALIPVWTSWPCHHVMEFFKTKVTNFYYAETIQTQFKLKAFGLFQMTKRIK